MHIEPKGYIVGFDGVIWGVGKTAAAAWEDAHKEGLRVPDGEAQCWPATNRLLAMIMLYGGSVFWAICDGVACYMDEGK